MTARQRFAFIVLGYVVAALPAATAANEPASNPSIRGTVSSITPANDAAAKRGILATMLVEGAKEKDTEYDKAHVKITDKTKIEKLGGKERKPAKLEDIKKGAKLECMFVGPVAESYPVQATAGSVLILEPPKAK